MKIIPPIVGVPSFFKCLSLINLLTDCPKCNFLNNGTTNKPVIKDKITMYDDKGKIISYAYLYDWIEVSYIDNLGEKHLLKSDFKKEA